MRRASERARRPPLKLRRVAGAEPRGKQPLVRNKGKKTRPRAGPLCVRSRARTSTALLSATNVGNRLRARACSWLREVETRRVPADGPDGPQVCGGEQQAERRPGRAERRAREDALAGEGSCIAVLRRLAMTDNELESALSALPPASGHCSHARELSARARRRASPHATALQRTQAEWSWRSCLSRQFWAQGAACGSSVQCRKSS